MITVKLQDKLAAHESTAFNSANQDNIIISRDDIKPVMLLYILI